MIQHYLAILILLLLTAFLYVRLKKILALSVIRIKDAYQNAITEYEKLSTDNNLLKKENENLKGVLEGTIALYDITRQICKHLDPEKVFTSFKDEIDKYIQGKDYKFIRGDIEPDRQENQIILPLNIGSNTAGYVVANGINSYDKDKFYIVSHQLLSGLKRSILYQQVQELSIVDGLTEVLSRRYFMERLQEEIERAKKFKHFLSFLMIDLDYFKEYNDRYGHLVGDAILKEVSRIIKENLRQIDLVGRYAGDEFAVVLTDTDKIGALFAAERIRQSVAGKIIRAYNEDLRVTISIGVSEFPDDADNIQKLIDNADVALYQAKEIGRNRVHLYTP